MIPYAQGGLLAKIHADGQVLGEEYTAEGIDVTALADEQLFAVWPRSWANRPSRGRTKEKGRKTVFSLQTLAALTLGTTMMFEAWGYMLPQQNPTDLLILVNKTNKAPAVPVTLVKPNVQPTRESASENIYMRPEAAAALEALFAGAAEDGLTLYATSGYRSYSTQKAIFERKLDRMSEKQANLSVAKPSYSEHQTGLAMDIEGETTKGTGLTEAFGESPEGIWAAKHCAEYGFIIRYPKDKTKITGYIYEPWHLRYVGREAAQEITALDVTFEEYIAMVRSDRIQWLQEETQYDDQNP